VLLPMLFRGVFHEIDVWKPTWRVDSHIGNTF
jgi:hypothetical protein